MDSAKTMGKLAKALRYLLGSAQGLGLAPSDALSNEIHTVLDDCSKIETGDDEPLAIAVAGKFSSGKSQFINSMIGQDIAPVATVRTTCCKTIFRGDAGGKKIHIVDANGKTVPIQTYRKRAARKAASEKSFVVYLPDPAWEGLALVDTPGFDAPQADDGDTSDAQISKKAAREADVVFFLLDSQDGTLKDDSKKYLKEYLADVAPNNPDVYLILNKADLKRTKIKIIRENVQRVCQDNDIRYKDVIPYCSLTKRSNELKTRPEAGRQRALELATKSKKLIWDVIRTLQSRKQARHSGRRAAAEKRLYEIADKACRVFSEHLQCAVDKFGQEDSVDVDTLAEEIADILADWMVDYLRVHPHGCQQQELPGTSFLCSGNDWRISLNDPGNTYQLSVLDADHLATEIQCDVLDNSHEAFNNLGGRFPAIFRDVADTCIRSLRLLPGYTKICKKRKVAECKRELSTRLALNIKFPFKLLCLSAVTTVLRQALKDYEKARRGDFETKAAILKNAVSDLRSILARQNNCDILNKKPFGNRNRIHRRRINRFSKPCAVN